MSTDNILGDVKFNWKHYGSFLPEIVLLFYEYFSKTWITFTYLHYMWKNVITLLSSDLILLNIIIVLWRLPYAIIWYTVYLCYFDLRCVVDLTGHVDLCHGCIEPTMPSWPRCIKLTFMSHAMIITLTRQIYVAELSVISWPAYAMLTCLCHVDLPMPCWPAYAMLTCLWNDGVLCLFCAHCLG